MAVTSCPASVCNRPVHVSLRCKHLRCNAPCSMAAVAEREGKIEHAHASQNRVATGKVYITRHGERADLADERWVATTTASDDPPLTQQGMQQAHELGLRLQREHIAHIYSSPFTRTAQTAQGVASCLGNDVAIYIEDGLAEGMLTRLFPAGRPNFRSPEHLKSTCSSIDPSYQSLLQLHFPEDYKDAQARCRQIAHALADRHQDENILLATALVTKEKCSLHIPYCCLTECKRDSNGDWTYGLHMDQEFLSRKQEKSDADKQRELWGLDDNTA